MKKIISFFAILFCMNAFADTATPPASPRVSLFSTTVDWSGVTGLSLSQYVGNFSGRDYS